MNSKIAPYLISSLLIILIFAFKNDDDPLLKLLNQIETYTNKYAQEKVYIQCDKPYYAVGDNIWLKAYSLNTKTQAPSKISKILYVELIDENDIIKNQIKLSMNDGVAWGDFKLPDTLIEGNYRLRAYTNYMRNFSSDFFFDKMIKIGKSWSNNVFTNTAFTYVDSEKIKTSIQFKDKNDQPYRSKHVFFEIIVDGKTFSKDNVKTDDEGKAIINLSLKNSQSKIVKIKTTLSLSTQEKVNKIISIVSLSNQADVQFFPESGNLIQGQPQKIGIKAIASNGLGTDIVGKVVDENGTALTEFKTDFAGIGSFMTSLQAGKKYFAKIKFNDGSEKNFDLPIVSATGYTLTVNNNTPQKIALRLSTSANLVNNDEIRVVGQQGGNLRFAFNARLGSQTIIKSIPSDKFTTGIAQITVFSSTNEPIAERLIFINNESSILKMNLKTEKLAHSIGGKSELTFSNLKKEDHLTGSFSVSVTNTNIADPDLNNESNILTSLLLTGDLTGYIEKPNHYFLKDDEQTRMELDNLMLTQGWRRFSWENILKEETPPLTFKPEISSFVSGLVVKGNNPVKGVTVFLMSKNGGDIVRDTLTNEEGKFRFDNLEFIDSTQFLVQATPLKKGSFLQLKIDSSDHQIITKNKNVADIDINVNNSLMKYIKASDSYFNEMARIGLLDKTIKLKDVNISAERIKKAVQYSSNYNGPGNADQVLTADDLPPNYSTLSQSLGNMLRGVRIVGGRAYLIFSRINPNATPRSPLGVYYNGSRLPDGNLDLINPMDVQSIELLTSISRMSIYGLLRDPGIILITTKKGLGYSAKKVKDLNFDHYTIKPKGLYVARTFYIPKYQITKVPIDDSRSTIYWNPNITPNNEGVATINFDNAYAKGNYRIVIEGMNNMGQLVRETVDYIVDNNP